MHNLHTTQLPTGDTVLTPVLPPKPVSDLKNAKLLAEIPVDDKKLLAVESDDALGLLDPETGDILWLGDYHGEILCALGSDKRLTAMTASGPVDYKLAGDSDGGRWSDVDSRRWAPLSVRAVPGSQATSVVAPRQLSKAYTHVGTSLLDVDRRAVTADLRRAYTDLVRQAHAQGSFCAPVMMRYRLIGHKGEVIYTSAPQLLGPSSTSMLTAPMTLTSSDYQTLDSHVVAAPSWRPSLVGCGEVSEEMARSVSRIELLAAPQFHPFDPEGEADINIVWNSSDKTMMRVSMPGVSRAVASGNARLGEARLRQMLAVLPSVERVVAVVNGPFKVGERIMTVPDLQFAFGSLTDECRAVEKAMNLLPETVDPVLQKLSWPNAITAGDVTAVGEWVIWGVSNCLRFSGYPVGLFAASCTDGPWHAAVSVEFASGDERLVCVDEGETDAPALFNPLICYPSADAVSITIVLSHAGKVCRAVLPLKPDPSGRWSYYLNTSFAPFRLTEEIDAFIVPPERRILRPMAGYLALARSDTPTDIVAAISLGDTKIQSLFPASRSQSSWDFSKVRFSVLTATGVFTVTVTPGKVPRISANLIDPRASPGPYAALRVSDRLLAILEDTLVEIGPSKCKNLKIVPSDRSDRSDKSDNSDKSIANTLTDYTRDEIITGRVVGHYAVVDGQICDLTLTRDVDSVYVRWDGLINFGDDYIKPRKLIFDIRSPRISYGELTVSRMSHADIEPSPSLRLTLDGAVGSPVVTSLPALPMRSAAFTFQGRLHPSSTIKSLKIL